MPLRRFFSRAIGQRPARDTRSSTTTLESAWRRPRTRDVRRPDGAISGPRRLTAGGVVTLAPQLRLLSFLLADFAAVLAPLSALGNLTTAGRVSAFLGAGHFTPPRGRSHCRSSNRHCAVRTGNRPGGA